MMSYSFWMFLAKLLLAFEAGWTTTTRLQHVGVGFPKLHLGSRNPVSMSDSFFSLSKKHTESKGSKIHECPVPWISGQSILLLV